MFETANYIEACFWALIGLGFTFAAIRNANARRQLLVLAAAFLLFGLSDTVEAGTGAWWRPWWLLVWKGLCLMLFGGFLFRYWRKRRAAGAPVAPETQERHC
jgi:hypothetical protein